MKAGRHIYQSMMRSGLMKSGRHYKAVTLTQVRQIFACGAYFGPK
jgi:hypothetical protein